MKKKTICDDAEIVRMIDQMDLADNEEEEIVASRSQHPGDIYSNSEASDDSESQLEGTDTDDQLFLWNYRGQRQRI